MEERTYYSSEVKINGTTEQCTRELERICGTSILLQFGKLYANSHFIDVSRIEFTNDYKYYSITLSRADITLIKELATPTKNERIKLIHKKN